MSFLSLIGNFLSLDLFFDYMSVLLFGVVPHSKYCFVKKVIFVLQKSSFPLNQASAKLSTSWMIYFQLSKQNIVWSMSLLYPIDVYLNNDNVSVFPH